MPQGVRDQETGKSPAEKGGWRFGEEEETSLPHCPLPNTHPPGSQVTQNTLEGSAHAADRNCVKIRKRPQRI